MNILVVLGVIGFALAAFAFFNGIVSMAHGGAEDQKSSHLHMFKRVGWQALAVLFILMGLLSQLA